MKTQNNISSMLVNSTLNNSTLSISTTRKLTLNVILLTTLLVIANYIFASDAHAEQEKDGQHHAEAIHEDEHGDEQEESGAGHEEKGHDDEEDHGGHEGGEGDEHGHGEEEQSVKMTAKQLETANIVVKELQLNNVAEVITAPGEIMLNEYKTASVTPRVSAQVVKRHAKLGDSVITGQPLLTLSSVEMASAQGDLLVSAREWLRVKKLGRKVVSESRYTEARVEHEQAKARVLAYGMTSKQITSFLKSGDASKTNGTFQLLSPQDGTVIYDRFIVGELIEPGTKLFIISDESVLWVEAKLTPAQVKDVSIGAAVTVIADGKSFTGKVVQVHHALDEDTRTLGVRIEIANPEDQLHPGVFVQAKINSVNNERALSVPVNALLRSPDGDWVIFTEHETGEFEPLEVELVKTVGDRALIDGVDAGTRVVVEGAFFVQSELAKAGFEIHNH